MAIERIDVTHHQLDLDPPFPAAWDTRPRRRFPATIVRVVDSSGAVGVGTGDPLYGFDDFAHLFVGTDPLDLARHGAVLDNIAFHAGRPWPVEVALWDLAGRMRGQPVWRLLGGRTDRVRAYASSGTHRSAAATVDLAHRVLDRGMAALKLRFGRARIEDDLAVLGAVRAAVGDRLELMVDCNQGWRMPWDTAAPWDLDRATAVARELDDLDVYWMEEPLHRSDHAGMAELRRRVAVRVAGGEMTREAYELRQMLAAGSLDVYQPDAAVTIGIGALASLAADVVAAGHVFTPHTWGNGLGLVANLHLTAGTVGAPFLEFPFDPPEWTLDRRDFVLLHPVDVDADGWLVLDDAPGFGVALDDDRLARTLTDRSTYH